MIKRTPQEIADFFQCYAVQLKSGAWFLYENKPKFCNVYWERQGGEVFAQSKYILNVPNDHDWTHLYEPRKSITSETTALDTRNQPKTAENSVITSDSGTNQQGKDSAKSAEISSNYQKEADSDNKEDSYYQDSPKVDNKPDHLGEVYTHKEYEVVSTVSKPSLISTVNSLMKDGWKPQGGVSYLNGLFYQAMVRGV